VIHVLQHVIHVQLAVWEAEFVVACSTAAYETYSTVYDATVVAAVHPLAKAVAKQLQLAVANQIS
jgi:hypothetical protein